ncbi:hypothetical protein HPC49_35365 [Pyxidicoccus fallax]|uniref:Ig-like domain-containing protein n=1 Tax=Pyxidicoccus fallax TaxID=394095 RepID=A0A848LW70_9BACT|nr:Ig-like domain-containing protein [Pyxidicoccus fallax]NMO21881.1 Ig-like domain-containing protein [Pyxidicoccus fallax]NPC83491.1 hypothetical protein [Pyxidicoccus fallax]
MKPRLSRHPWMALLLCTALGPIACEPLKQEPDPLPPPKEEPTPIELRVSVATDAPAYCREGTWPVSVSVEGGTPEQVELDVGGGIREVLTPPFQYTLDCATHGEGPVSLKATAWARGRSFVSPSASVVVDRTPPQLATWLQRWQTYPSMDMPLEFFFSEPLLPESLQATPFQIRDGNGFSVAYQTVLSEDGKVLRVEPTAPLRPPVTLNITLTQTNMTDRAGNPFKVGDVLSLEQRVSYWPFTQVGAALSQEHVEFVAFALDWRRPARQVVVFIEWPDTEELAVARWDGETGAWERFPPPREPEARSVTPTRAQVEVTSRGEVVLAWTEEGFSGKALLHVTRYDGTSWTRMGAPIATESEIAAYQIAVAHDGTPTLVYRDNEGELRVMRWTGSSWEFLGGPLSANPRVRTLASRPAIAVDGNTVVVAWAEAAPEGPGAYVHVARYENGSWSFLGQPLRGWDNGYAECVDISLRASGPHVAWMEYFEYPRAGSVYYSQLTSDSQTGYYWKTPEPLQEVLPFEVLTEVWLEVGSDGDPRVAWMRRGDGYSTESVYRRRRVTGWDPEQLILGSTLWGFRVDEKGYPWAITGYPRESAILRPQ